MRAFEQAGVAAIHIEDHSGAFSGLVQFAALNEALGRFKAGAATPGGQQAFEEFLGYRDYAERADKYST